MTMHGTAGWFLDVATARPVENFARGLGSLSRLDAGSARLPPIAPAHWGPLQTPPARAAIPVPSGQKLLIRQEVGFRGSRRGRPFKIASPGMNLTPG
jgi:hypothetical protein